MICRVCGNEINKGSVFIIKHIKVTKDERTTREAWLPVHCLCNAEMNAGRARLAGGMSTPPGHAINDALMLPVAH